MYAPPLDEDEQLALLSEAAKAELEEQPFVSPLSRSITPPPVSSSSPVVVASILLLLLLLSSCSAEDDDSPPPPLPLSASHAALPWIFSCLEAPRRLAERGRGGG